MALDIFQNQNGRWYINNVDAQGSHWRPTVWDDSNQYATQSAARAAARKARLAQHG